MNILEYIDSIPIMQALGWTLLHFVWQGALLAALLSSVLCLMDRRGAMARYLVCCAGLACMLAAPVVTLVIIIQSPSQSIALAASEIFLFNIDSLSIWQKIAPVMPWITLIWFLGSLWLQGRLILHWFNAQHMVRHGTETAPLIWRQTVSDLCDQLKIRQKVRLVKSSLARVPMVTGWLKPVILAPTSVFTGLTPQQLKMILAHELAHVRRYDYVVNVIQSVLEALLFYHPAVWWLSSRIRAEREYCCDDVAVNVCRDPLCYAKALSSLDLLRDSKGQTAIASTGGSLMKRIFRIVNVKSRPSYRMGGWLAPIIIALSLTAAVSAMNLSPAMPEDGDASKKVVVQNDELISKLKAKGLSDKEIKAYLHKMKQKQEEAKKKEEAIKKEKQLVEKLRKAGKSDKEIKLFLADINNKKSAKKKRSMSASYEEELIRKLKAKGLSKKEISAYLEKLHKQKALKDKVVMEAKKNASSEDDLIKKLKAKGLSDKEIRGVIFEKTQKDEEWKKKADAEKNLIKKLRAKGLSNEEIKEYLNSMKKKEIEPKRMKK